MLPEENGRGSRTESSQPQPQWPRHDRRAAYLGANSIASHLWRRSRSYAPWIAGLAAALLLDRLVFSRLAITDPARLARLESNDLYRTLRVMGSLWPWVIVAAVFVLLDGAGRRPAAMFRRAGFLLLSAALSGAAAELLKPLVGRFKPGNSGGPMEFAAFSERLSRWSDLGMASSHAAVAFGAAMALSVMIPRAAPVFLLGAIGCAVTRLLAGAHYLSDVYVGLLLAYAVTRAIVRLDLRNNDGRPIHSA